MFHKQSLIVRNLGRVAAGTLIPLLLAGLGLWFGSRALAAGNRAPTATYTVCASGCDYSSIQAAIDGATDGDTLKLAAETFTEAVTIDKSLTIQGVTRESTIVQAASAPDLATSRVITVTPGVTVTIEHITVRYGFAQESIWNFSGGGILSEGFLTLAHSDIVSNTSEGFGGGISGFGDTTLVDVTVAGNVASGGGGGISCGSGEMKLADVTVSGNTASTNGGGMDASFCPPPTLTDVTLSNNTASSDGGGMCTFESDARLTNVTFVGNSAGHYGGGMANWMSSPTLSGVTFSNNSAIKGGGVYNNASNAAFAGVLFSGNVVTQDGGGLDEYQSNSTFTNAIFYGNSAGNWGGGVCSEQSSSMFTNVLFSGNHATVRGGAVYNLDSDNGFTNVTIASNSAGGSGAGICNQSSDPVLTNVIYWGNVDPDGQTSMEHYSSTPTISYSNMQGCGSSASWHPTCGADGGHNIDADPLFVREPNPGDGDWTTLADNDYGDLHLQLGSPAANAGTNAGCPTTDLDGVPRPQGIRCDIGTYEFGGYSSCIVGLWGASHYRDIQSAVDDDQCQIIHVNPGRYYENVDIDRTVELVGTTGVTVDGDDRGSVFTISAGVTVTIRNMAITNGSAYYGGCIENWGTLVLQNASVEFCEADSYGGGIYNRGTLLAEDAYIATNQAAVGGGGICTSSGSLVSISDSMIFNNRASSIGGGIYGSDGNFPPEGRIVIDNSQIVENQAGSSGGGLWIDSLAECTITDGEIHFNTAGSNGGGIYVQDDAPLFIKDTLVSHNQASGEGGGISARSNLTMIHTTLEYNHADGDGGGLSSIVGSRATITASTINQNTALDGAGIQTGVNAQVSIENSDIISNTASDSGGGLHIDYGGRITITNSTIQDNVATHTGGGIGRDNADYGDLYLRIRTSTIAANQAEIGGGIYCTGGRWDLIEFDIGSTRIRRNQSTNGRGGGVYFDVDLFNYASYLKLDSSIIRNNRATGDGAGVAIIGGQFYSTNSTYSWNSAQGNGGGIFIAPLSFTNAELKSLTIYRNTADSDQDDYGDGGGLYRLSTTGDVTVTASIIAGNRDQSSFLVNHEDCSGDFTSGTSNLIGNYAGSSGWGILDIVGTPTDPEDPMLLPLADNGGPTWTHEPEPNSPAVDGNAWADCPNKDQRGLQRPQGAHCDIGAFELGTCDPPVAPALSVARDGHDIQLAWNQNSANREYVVARVTDYILETDLFTTTVHGGSYTDYGAIGDPQNNYVYLVRGENACGDRSGRSNKVAEFDFQLDDASFQAPPATKRTPLHLVLISIPLTGSNLPTTAEELAAYIDPNGSVKGVGKWHARTKSWAIHRVGNPFGDNFAVAPGDVLAIGLNDARPETFAFVGDIPANGSLHNNLTREAINGIFVPLDQSGNFTLDADGLAAAIGGVARVAVWHPVEQRWYVRNINTGSGPNFAIQLGLPYAIYANDTAPLVWP